MSQHLLHGFYEARLWSFWSLRADTKTVSHRTTPKAVKYDWARHNAKIALIIMSIMIKYDVI